MSGKLVCVKDLKEYAASHLPEDVNTFINLGGNYEETLNDNTAAFSRLKICPRYLWNNVAERCLQTTILGSTVSIPICAAPVAMQRMVHPDGEVAVAKACEAANTIVTLSTVSTASIEEVAKAAPNAIKWFQLYIYTDRKITENLIRRAECSGFSAIVLTIDAPIIGIRYFEERSDFCLPSNLRLANFAEGDSASDSASESKDGSFIAEYVNSMFDASITWKDVEWLKSFTNLKLVLKGILTPEDAVKAIEIGVDAIIVSNHGGRQLDTVPASITVLPEIVRAVNNKCEVYLDGGVRCGTDVLKAIALGARAVFIGRPIMWGLSCDGETGVKKVLDILRNELDVAMALSGCPTVDQLKPYLVRHEKSFASLF